MINKPPPFRGLNVRIPSIIPIKGSRFMNQGSTLGFKVKGEHLWTSGRKRVT